MYYREIAMVTWMKARATLGGYIPNPLGDTRASMVDTMGCDTER